MTPLSLGEKCLEKLNGRYCVSLEQIERARIQRVIDENPEVFQEMIDEIQGWNICAINVDDAQTSDSPVSDKNVLSKAIKKMREKWENFINTRSSENSDGNGASSTLKIRHLFKIRTANKQHHLWKTQNLA